MGLQRFIRLAVIAWGSILMLVVMLANCGKAQVLLGQILFAAWNVLPNVVYSFSFSKSTSWVKLLLPAFLLCVVQLLFVTAYFRSASSSAALIFIFAPVYSLIVLAAGSLAAYLIDKIGK